jgi:hypothetical protein
MRPQHYSSHGWGPEDPRQSFLNWIGAGLDPSFFGPVSEGSYRADVRALNDELQECHETMPPWACLALDIPEGSSYSQAISVLLRDLGE